MTPTFILQEIIDPGLAFMARTIGPKPVTSDAARVMLLAIAGQEGNWRERRQIGGPARSLWQFEQGGGVKGVLGHPATGSWARQICAALAIPSDAPTVFEAMAWNDHLGVAMARFLLFTHPRPIPTTQDETYQYYDGLWRPGKPGPERWPANYSSALAAVDP